MTGSSYIPIVVPTMAFVAMFFWLGLVFHADSHPGWKPRRKPGHASVFDRPAAAVAGPVAGADADGAPEARRPDAAPGTGPASAPGPAPSAGRGAADRDLAAGEAPVGAGR